MARKSDVKKIASERIEILLNLARKTYHDDQALAQRYVDIALRISTRCRVRLPREYRLGICKGCKGLLIAGESCRVRIRQRREPHITITCLNCGAIKRMPLISKKG